MLAKAHPPRFETQVLGEPSLIFGGDQRCVDPRTGLGLYGPYDLRAPERRAQIRLGLIGTGETIDLTSRWTERCRGGLVPARQKRQRGTWIRVNMDPTVYPSFPGLRAVFDTDFVLSDVLTETLRAVDLAELERIELFEPRVGHLVDLLVDRIRVLSDKPTPPDVIIIALPSDVRRLCTLPTKHKRVARKPRSTESMQVQMFRESAAPEIAEHQHTVLHHALKARAMELGIPTQLIWQRTLEGNGVEDEATRGWNFWTGLYYKAGNIPWRIGQLSSGACYVGISFFVDRLKGNYRSCMAQAFSDDGEAFVIRGDSFEWDEFGSPHLTEEVARSLITQVLDEYERHLHRPPRRLIVHKWSRFRDPERIGFTEAIGSRVHSFDLVAFGSRGIRFFRTGQNPVLRGTLITLGPRNALLYTRGYVPFVGEYSGMRVPRPLEIVEHFGSASMTEIAREILSLTKMDWNSTAFAGKDPITTGFSEEVGHILAELPPGSPPPRSQYRFYM